MRWAGISGTWRLVTSELCLDLHREVVGILGAGDGIISGGALGVDFIATRLALSLNPTGGRIKVFLPTSFEIYRLHYLLRAEQGVVSESDVTHLIEQISELREISPGSLIENREHTIVNQASYYARNQSIVDAADYLYAFQVNSSQGTQDTIDKARERGIRVHVRTYAAIS
jgi:hypothetical protein